MHFLVRAKELNVSWRRVNRREIKREKNRSLARERRLLRAFFFRLTTAGIRIGFEWKEEGNENEKLKDASTQDQTTDL